MRFGLSENIFMKFRKVFEKYPEIEEVWIYGSRAKGDFREGSDIDITLKGRKITDQMRSKVWLDLDDLNTPYLIDLSVFHHISSESLIAHIERVGKVFYKKVEKIIA